MYITTHMYRQTHVLVNIYTYPHTHAEIYLNALEILILLSDDRSAYIYQHTSMQVAKYTCVSNGDEK